VSSQGLRELFGKTVCAHAGSLIAAALCLAGLLPVLLLGSVFVSEAWFQVLMTLVLAAGLLFFRTWPGYGLQVDSVIGVLLVASRFRRSLLSALAPARVAFFRR
jgi:hypothetical protein